jgi:outer membrane receptor protein involved in Fe transport
MTPLLDQFYAGSEAVSKFAHRRSYQFDLGGTTIGIETLRLQSKAADRLADRFDGATRSRSWSIGARSDWRLGSNDQLSFGLATTDEHRAQSRILAADPHIVTSVKTLGLTWSHRAHWQLSMGWQQTGGSSRGVTDRMVELASGAPLHESGMRLSLAFPPNGITDPHRTSLGFQARRESIASDDLALLGASRRQDMQGSLFLRTHF